MKKDPHKKDLYKKALYIISAILLVASSYMYWIMDNNQMSWQSPAVSILPALDDQKPQKKQQNQYVIRNGSNSMPKGMGQNDDDKPRFMPQWQKDQIKNNRGEPDIGSSDQVPSSPPTTVSQPSATPSTPPTTVNPGPDVNQGQGLAPRTYNNVP